MIPPRKGHIFYWKKHAIPCRVLDKSGDIYVCEIASTGHKFLAKASEMDIRRKYNFEVVKAIKKYAGKLSNSAIAAKLGLSEMTFYNAVKAADRELKKFKITC